MTNQANTPTLRFPEFSDGWEKKKLGEVFSNSKEKGNPSLPIYSVTQKYGLIPRDRVERNIQNDAAPGDNLVVNEDYLTYNMMRMWQGALGIAKIKCMVSPAYVVLKPSKITHSSFFMYYFERSRSLFLFKSYSHGLTLDRLRLYYDDFSSIPYFIPTLYEQQKIASFLSVVDEKLQALKKKKSLLEQYKKGVMQKIFSLELRFKADDGSEFPEWEVMTLGEIGETYSGLSGKSKEDFGIGKPYIQYKQIFDDSKIDISRFEFVNIGDNEKQNKVKFGDLFFTVSSETPNEIGTASVLLDYIDDLYLNSFCFGYRVHSLQDLSPYFSRYLFRSETFRTEIVKLAQGSTRYNMSKIQLLKIEINLPALEEQSKIANFLSAIDEKIILVQRQIEKMEIWKKGLLQKMFV